MGCLFGCFRAKESKSSIIGSPEPAVARSKNALSSLFQCDDESLRKEAEGRNTLPQELDVRELKNEAKFLKACGTLSETPTDIRKASGKWEGMPAQIREEKYSKFNSWLPTASVEKLKLEKHSDESPVPVKICDEWVTRSDSSLETPSSCITDGCNTRRVLSSSIQRRDSSNVMNPMRDSDTHSETLSVSTRVFAPSMQFKSSVCFDCESDRSAPSSKGSSSESASQHAEQSGSVGSRSVTKPSPGKMSTAYANDMAIGKVESPESNDMKDESSDPNHPKGSIKLNDEATSMSTPKPEMAIKHLSVDKEINETSLSSLLKPPSAKQDGSNKQFGSAPAQNVYRVRTPEDRPILGMVAAHWNDDEKSHVSPKWWDGNGIPNSTNKYKEDQKVSWHATPFEERLEKALSEETLISQRKPISKTPSVSFNEDEESDTALSHFQSSAHLKSVVSF